MDLKYQWHSVSSDLTITNTLTFIEKRPEMNSGGSRPSGWVSERERYLSKKTTLGPVVLRLVNANPGLDFKSGFFFFSSKAFSRTIFFILFRVSNHQIVDKKNSTEFALLAFTSDFKFRTNPGLS